MSGARIEGEHEGVAESAANGAGLDLIALRRRPRAAPRVPIVEQFAS
jgi:hypothetical protein